MMTGLSHGHTVAPLSCLVHDQAPVAGGDEGSEAVPRTGFEPATFCSGGNTSTPDEDQGSLNLSTFRPTWRLAA